MCKALDDLYQEGIDKGRIEQLTKQVKKKLEKNMSANEIAEALEEDVDIIKGLIADLQKE